MNECGAVIFIIVNGPDLREVELGKIWEETAFKQQCRGPKQCQNELLRIARKGEILQQRLGESRWVSLRGWKKKHPLPSILDTSTGHSGQEGCGLHSNCPRRWGHCRKWKWEGLLPSSGAIVLWNSHLSFCLTASFSCPVTMEIRTMAGSVRFYREATSIWACSRRKESWRACDWFLISSQRGLYRISVFSVDQVRSVFTTVRLFILGFPTDDPGTISFYVVCLGLFPLSGYF